METLTLPKSAPDQESALMAKIKRLTELTATLVKERSVKTTEMPDEYYSALRELQSAKQELNAVKDAKSKARQAQLEKIEAALEQAKNALAQREEIIKNNLFQGLMYEADDYFAFHSRVKYLAQIAKDLSEGKTMDSIKADLMDDFLNISPMQDRSPIRQLKHTTQMCVLQTMIRDWIFLLV